MSTPLWSPRTARSRTPGRRSSAALASTRCGPSPTTGLRAAESRWRCCCGRATPGATPPPTTSACSRRLWRSCRTTSRVAARDAASWSGSTAPAAPTRCLTGSPASGFRTPSGSVCPPTPATSSPRSPTTCGSRPTTQAGRSGTARGSPSSPVCSPCPAGPRACVSSCARNDRTPARSCA